MRRCSRRTEEGVVPADCTGCLAIQAETLRPPLAEDPLVVVLVVDPVLEDAPSRLRTICSLLLEGRLNVTCSAVEPRVPIPMETCSPPLAWLLMLIVICSGLLLPPFMLLRFRMISGPLAGEGEAAGLGTGGSN